MSSLLNPARPFVIAAMNWRWLNMRELLEGNPVIPVITIEDAGKVDHLADALLRGGVKVAEITLRTASGLAALESMAKRDDILVGAGTVTKLEQVRQVVDAGARFMVSPGFRDDIVQTALDMGLKVLPGAVTPSEIMAAQRLGLDVVKFFPAAAYGGLSVIKALHGPFGQMQFVPTGGVSMDNMMQYLSLPYVPAVGGTWFATAELIAAGDFDQISRLAAAAIHAATGV